MLIRVLFKLLWVLSLSAGAWGLSGTAAAHEFWLEPLDFTLQKGDNIQAHIKVGQALEGDTYGFYPANFERFELTVGDNAQPLLNRFAQKPVVDQTTTASGLHILTYQSKASKLRYERRATFEKFLKSEGVEWVLAAHKKRSLPPLDFTELYKRYAKSLVKVGEGNGSDRLMGMPFEWVVLTNPYTDTSRDAITAQLFFEQQPFPHSQVNIFIKRGDDVVQKKLTTDKDGKVHIPAIGGGLFLVNAVHMINPNKAGRSGDAAWMSLWASTTFLINE